MNRSSEGITILAVDDEPEILGIFSQYLSEEDNFRVLGARSVGEALEILTHEEVSAIVSDYQMPGTNGIDFLSLLREQGNTTPFILFTGRGCENVVIQALNLGADFYIVKGEEPSLQFQMLKKQIFALISRKKAEDALSESLKENRRTLSQLRATLEATEEGILVTDRDGYITNYNERFVLLWDIGHDSLLNVHIDQFVSRISHIIPDNAIITEILKTGDEPRSLRRNTLHCPDGRILEIYIRPQKCDERIIGTVYSFRDITPRVRAEMQLQESRERFRILFEHSPISHMVISPEGKIVEVNRAWLSMMKRTRESVIGLSFSDIVDPDIKPRFLTCLKEVLKANQKHSVELILLDGEEAKVTVLVDGSVVRDNEGKVIQIQCVLRDVTYQRMTEKRLKWTESLLTEVVNMLPFGICVTRNAELEIFYHNKHFLEIWGPEIIAEVPRKGSSPTLKDFFSVVPDYQEQLVKSWEPDICTHPDISCRDIELPGRRIIRAYNRVLSEDSGEVRTLWAFEDATRFRDQEEEIRRYARKIEILSRVISLSGRAGSVSLLCELSLSALVSVLHFEGGAFYLLSDDKSIAQMIAHSGLSKEFVEEIREIPVSDYSFLYSERKPLFTNNLSQMKPEFAKRWGISGSAYIPVLAGDRVIGSIHLTSKRAALVPIEEQEVLLGIGREIGNGLERLRDQKLLGEERRNFENLVHSIGDMVIVIDAISKTILAVNDEVSRKTGQYKNELIGKTIPDSRSGYLTALPLEKAGEEIQSVKYTVPLPDGSRSVIEARITTGMWNSRASFFCVCRDITASIGVQEEIRLSEERLNAIFLTCPIGIILFDPDDRMIQINPAAISLFHISDPVVMIRYSYETDPNIPDPIKEKIRNRESFTAELAYDLSLMSNSGVRMSPVSGIIYIRIMVTPVTFSVSGMRDGFFILIEDITARHRIESEMKKLTRQLGQIMDASNDGFFVYHIQKDTLSVSSRLKNLLSIHGDSDEYPLSDIMACIHEDDRAIVSSSFRSLVTGDETSISHEIQVKNPAEGWLWVFLRGKITGFDAAGKPNIMAGAVTDITRRKRSEQKLLESESFNRSLVTSLPDYLMIYDPSGTVLYVNESSVRAMRMSGTALVGSNILDFIVPEMRSLVKMQSEKRLQGEVIEPYEVKILRSDSSMIDAEVQARTITYQGGPAILAVLTDITERKRNEEDLARYAETLKETIEALASANRKLNLLSNVTRHDILNQIHIVLSYLALLQESPLGAEEERILEKIAYAVGFIQRHIEFTRNYQEIGVQSPAWQSPGDIIRKLDFEGMRVDINLDSLEIYADPLFPKVFENLLDNAFRHGDHVTVITVNYEIQPDDQLLLVWEDNGSGVPDDAKSRIFERGYGKNTGLGLFLIREILALTGITIYESGKPGTGAQFCLLIPQDKYHFSR